VDKQLQAWVRFCHPQVVACGLPAGPDWLCDGTGQRELAASEGLEAAYLFGKAALSVLSGSPAREGTRPLGWRSAPIVGSDRNVYVSSPVPELITLGREPTLPVLRVEYGHPRQTAVTSRFAGPGPLVETWTER
jgi:hypothetical protein